MPEEIPLAVVHRMPFKSSFRGTTDIARDFYPTIRPFDAEQTPLGAPLPPSTGGPLFLARFRGRRLIGREVELPSSGKEGNTSYCGCVFTMPHSDRKRARDEFSVLEGIHNIPSAPNAEVPSAAIVSDNVVILETFDRLTVWEHDREPTDQDTRNITLWLELSDEIHRPA